MNYSSALSIFVTVLVLFLVFSAANAVARDDDDEIKSTVSLNGFVETGYIGNITNGENTYLLQQVELDIERKYGDMLLLRADLETAPIDLETDVTGGDVQAEQGFVQYSHPELPELILTFGKFNAPFGVEAVDAPEMETLTHSLAFTYLTPLSFTGAMITGKLGRGMYAQAFISNGWDQEIDVNKGKTTGGRFGYSSDQLSGGISASHGANDALERWDEFVIDGDIRWRPVPELLIAAEVAFGFADSQREQLDDANWLGGLFMTSYRFSDLFALSARYDYVSDQDGYLWHYGEDVYQSSVSLVPMLHLGYGLQAGLEARVFTSGDKLYENDSGDAQKAMTHLLFEMTYTF